MNKELEEKLISSFENIESFTLEQAPLVVQEMMNFHYNLYMAGFIISLTVSILGLLMIPYVARNIDATASDEDMGKFVLSTLTMFFGIVFGIPLAIFNGYNLLYMTIAPKLYVLEQIGDLL